MKYVISLVLIMAVFSHAARADQIEIKQVVNGMVTSASYSKVEIRKGDAKMFEGRTDKYGRISVTIPNGDYQAIVTLGSTTQKAQVKITGDKKLKQILAK